MTPSARLPPATWCRVPEKLWGATSQALKAYCASHGMAHSKYANRRHAAFQLADQLDNPFVRATFGVAESCHANFYNDWMEQENTWTATCRILSRW